MSSLVDRLVRYSEDRGFMSSLRCALIESKRHRAWPALSRLGVPVNDNCAAVLSGLYASHPLSTTEGNFGHTCRQIEIRRGDKRTDDNKLTPTERRFQYLLSAEPGYEFFDRLTRMLLLAKSQNVPVNYTKLEQDMRYWNDRRKNEWATAFWAPGVAEGSDEGES